MVSVSDSTWQLSDGLALNMVNTHLLLEVFQLQHRLGEELVHNRVIVGQETPDHDVQMSLVSDHDVKMSLVASLRS